MSSNQFRRLRRSTLRDLITHGTLPDLEIELFKEHADRFRWSAEDRETLLNMTTEVLELQLGHTALEVHVRTLAQSSHATVDYLSQDERFNVKQCVLLVGDVGRVPQPWFQLIQPALYLFKQECNIFWIELPSLASNDAVWLKLGPGILLGVLKFLNVDKVSGVACGSGGAVLLQALVAGPSLFRGTHFIYNLDLPFTIRGTPIPMAAIADVMMHRDLQLWFAYDDDAPVYTRASEGTASRAWNVVGKLQAGMEGERRRSRQKRTFDDVLISDGLNRPRAEHVKKVSASLNNLAYKFSEPLLSSLHGYLVSRPTTFQDNLFHGLVNVYNAIAHQAEEKGQAFDSLPELPSLRAQRLKPQPQERALKAESNRKRLERLQVAALCLEQAPLAITPSVSRQSTPGHMPKALRLNMSPSAPELSLPNAKASKQALPDSFWSSGSGSLAPLTLPLPCRPEAGREVYQREWAELRTPVAALNS